MKQLTYSPANGAVELVDVPPPQLRGPGILVHTAASVISPGTERMSLDFGRASLVGKARQRPDLVRQVLEKTRRDGLVAAARVALNRLDRPSGPGYACAGTVREIAGSVSDFRVGDHVACAGGGYATHAEINYVPKNLAVLIPRRSNGELIGFDEAAFATLGAIALHGVRLAQPQLGDRAVVIGLGVIGLLAAQILRAHGCHVLGIDVDLQRCEMAARLGIDEIATPGEAHATCSAWTRGMGSDLVLITAASGSSAPAVLATELARDRGRLVAVGATGLDLPRRTCYEKELSVIVSRSYGPGRYDPNFEERGHDYPAAFVRWTERENMRAFLDLVARGSVDVRSLVSHRFPVTEAEAAYRILDSREAMGIVLEYPHQEHRVPPSTQVRLRPVSTALESKAVVTFVGAGSFARDVLLPVISKRRDVHLRAVVTANGLSARSAGDKFGFELCSTSEHDAWQDPASHAVVIATRHDRHAEFVARALRAGKAVFVEKPLALNERELAMLEDAYLDAAASDSAPLVMVGFNRRFAPMTTQVAAHFKQVTSPINVLYRVNAGRLPANNWQAGDEGGGRVIGEVCHFVDLCAFLCRSRVREVTASRSSANDEDVMIVLQMENGSVATIAYMTEGDRSMPKERLEVFGGGRAAVIDDFRSGSISGNGQRRRLGGFFALQDKGHQRELAEFVHAVRHKGPSPIPFEDAVNVTRTTFAVLKSLERRTAVSVVR
jgi:polar amino acid transport system substrate-binding protein